jgi:hypothetical protein
MKSITNVKQQLVSKPCDAPRLSEPCVVRTVRVRTVHPAPVPSAAGAKEGSPGPARSAPPRDQQKIEFRPAGPTEKRRRNPLCRPFGAQRF